MVGVEGEEKAQIAALLDFVDRLGRATEVGFCSFEGDDFLAVIMDVSV